MNQTEDMRFDERSREGRQMTGRAGARTKCDEIQPLLLDFLTRDLGQARADVVREHLRRCQSCRAAASELQATVDALRRIPGAAHNDQKLSEKHRAKILRSITHPILAWIDRHHALVSVLVVILTAVVVFGLLKRVRLLKEDRSTHITVTIGIGAPHEGQPASDTSGNERNGEEGAQ